MDCHLSKLIGAPSLLSHHFYAGCPSWHNPPNLSWLGTGTKYAGLHTQWIKKIKGVSVIYLEMAVQIYVHVCTSTCMHVFCMYILFQQFGSVMVLEAIGLCFLAGI